MKTLKFAPMIALAGLAAICAAPANATPYYLFDGDSSAGVEIDNGAVVNSFSTFFHAYPVAIDNGSIWLGERDNGGATQYNLDGTPTGATSAGGDFITQILDGTSDGTHNYGVTCCGTQEVTIANNDWSNQQALFSIGGFNGGAGIAYDSSNGQLYVSDFGDQITAYSLDGTALARFGAGGLVVGLAYDQSTDTLWGWNRSGGTLDQFDPNSGQLLQSQSIDLSNTNISNPFGGEMSISDQQAGVPEPAAWALMIMGFGAAGAALRRRRMAVT